VCGEESTDHGGASCNGGLSADVEVVGGNGAHEGQLHVRVRVNATWDKRRTTQVRDKPNEPSARGEQRRSSDYDEA
jgi:hypothetical protein